MTPLIPCLRYDDPHAAIAWLERCLGATRHMVVEDGSGGIAHAQILVAGGMVMLGGRRRSGEPLDDALDAIRSCVYATVADPDAQHARAVAAGAEALRAPFDTGYGSRDWIARDPEGHLWCFGTYDPFAPTPD
jgi:uncharacterized glyoxalase superfamily protein PhnB